MRHADSLVLVWKLAEIEAQHLGSPLIEPAHYFLGLLKVVDIDLDRVLDLRGLGGSADQIRRDVTDLRLAFDRANVETTLVRRQLRNRLRKGPDQNNGHLRRSTQSRIAFKISEAFAKSGMLKPIGLLSILIEFSIPCIDEVLQDLTQNRDLLLDASTKVALSAAAPGEKRADESPLQQWERTFHNLTTQGWSVNWTRFISEDILFWRVEATKDGISHVVQGEDITSALIELDRAICRL
jgi:hypothetical protein